jgi:hypothetical protein
VYYSAFFLTTLFFITGCKHTGSADSKKTAAAAVIGTRKLTGHYNGDTALFDNALKVIANNDSGHLWPAAMPYPLAGALLPFNRIIAFYGNIYDSNMGIVGELPKAELIKKLKSEMLSWSAADTATPVIPAFHCVAVEKWDEPNTDGKLRDRVPFAQIDTLLNWAGELNGLVFLDLQVGNSTLQQELPLLEKYLSLPNVHLGIDAEFSIKNNANPAEPIGSFNSEDVNYSIDFLAGLVKKYHLPPRILIVHRFTENMIKGYEKIKKTPEVQVVINMDGIGDKAAKEYSYYNFVYKQPVEFTGFKLFYKLDKTHGMPIMSPKEILQLVPRPVYIQYE